MIRAFRSWSRSSWDRKNETREFFRRTAAPPCARTITGCEVVTAFSYIAVAGRPHLRFASYLKRWLPKAVKLVPKAPAEVSIALLGGTKMAALHKKFMNKAESTDVLTFELAHDARGRVAAGEVVVCVSYARKEAKRRGVKVENELLLYALHGVLHLSGYDDGTSVEHARMHKEEDRILKAIGIGEVFNRPERTRSRRKIEPCPVNRS